MLKNRTNKIEGKKLKGKAGFDANESRFGGDIHELRERKSLSVPTLKNGVTIRMEQGWNGKSKIKDVVRITLIDVRKKIKISTIIEREDLEQLISYMAQGDELIKYTSPKINYEKNPNLEHIKIGKGLYNKPI